MSNDKNIMITVSSKEYAFLKKVCLGARTTIPNFIRALIQRFAADPERFIRVFDDYEK